jgi:hypothetical protein
MPTKADLRTVADGYLAKARMDLLNNIIREAKVLIRNQAERGKYHFCYNVYVYNSDTEYCSAFLNGVKSEYPDIDVSVDHIDEEGYTTYRFSWKD